MNDDQWALTNFAGKVRLFPLPNLVLFPHVVQPLHVFEPRYRQMTDDALGDDKLIAVVLLKPGWEDVQEKKPKIHKVACLGRIIAEQPLPDGRYNLLLRGLQRVKLAREVSSDRLYRMAQAELLGEPPPPTIADLKDLRKLLAEKVLPRFTAAGQAQQQLQELFDGELPLGALCDILSFALPIDLTEKQTLLEALNVTERAGMLMQSIDCLSPPQPPGDRKFPPDFSIN